MHISGRILSTQLNCNSKNGSDIVNFLSTQWSADGSTSSEPMGLCITSIVKTLTENHTLDKHRTSRTPHNVAAVRDSVVHSPSKPVRGRSQELGINRDSVRKILIADLHMYPYRIQIKQMLTPDDMRKRVIMCQWFRDKIDAVPDFLDNVWLSDVAHFLLSGHVNSKNNIFWSSTPPEHCLQRPLHSVKCTAWVPISKHGIIGPFWFENDNERSVTINTERYVQVLGKFWAALGRWRGVTRVLQSFQQDGANPHSSKESLAWLQQRFPDRLISRRCDPQWSSPDLNPSDF